MPAAIRPLIKEELKDANSLCRRSKAYWGHDAAFMEACRGELTLSATDLEGGLSVGMCDGGGILGATD